MRAPCVLGLAAAFFLSACAGADKGSPPDPVAALRLLGAWDTKAQFDAAPDALKITPRAGEATPWLDRQHATFVVVNAPRLTEAGETAIFLRWRSGGPDGPISRERIWVFEPGPDGGFTRMDFHTLKRPAPAEALAAPLSAFRDLEPDDVIAYPEACKLPVTATTAGWRAAIPEDCAIVARSGRPMRLSARIELSGGALTYEEAGVLESGAVAFKVPGGPAYRFERVADAPRAKEAAP
jgi:hypothetical protein